MFQLAASAPGPPDRQHQRPVLGVNGALDDSRAQSLSFLTQFLNPSRQVFPAKVTVFMEQRQAISTTSFEIPDPQDP